MNMKRGQGFYAVWRGLALGALFAGCAHQPQTRSLAFAGGQVESTPEVLASAQAWVVSTPKGEESLDLRISNRGSRRLEMGAVVDRFTALTRQGDSISLESADFFGYPNALAAGEEVSVKLKLPEELPVYELSQLNATIDHGRTALTLVPIGPPVSRPGPRIAPSGAPDLLGEQAAYGAVPIRVEFQQELGAVLAATIWWDDTRELVTLTSGHEESFALVPGRHELHMTSELAQLGKTEGHVSIDVPPDEPLRVTIDGRPTFFGTELRVRVWTHTALVSDQLFRPASLAPHARRYAIIRIGV